MGAGALWGLVFLAPILGSAFSALQLCIGRYVCYGLIAAVWVAPRWHSLTAQIKRHHWLSLAWLAFMGNTLYYILLTNAVRSGGVAMTSLVIGFLPVAVTVIGSRDDAAVSFRTLVPSLLLSAAGAGCIGWQTLAGASVGSTGSRLVGLLCAIGALASWTAYAVGNARCLDAQPQLSTHAWNLLTGVMTGAQSVILIPLALYVDSVHHDACQWQQFGALSLGVAALASIAGNSLWNRMTRLLPLTLVGQMILFETLFALLYGFLWEHRLPTLLEMATLILLLASVLSCLAAHRIPATSAGID
jgi:drug/metabolite transporter (DMT)-like permease